YTGTTTVNAGFLELNKTGVTALAGALVIGDGSGTDGVLQDANDQIADTKTITINSSGTWDLGGNSETAGAITLTGGTILTNGATLPLNGNVTTNASANSATISGNLNLGTIARTFTVADGAAADDLAVSGTISGSAGWTKAGTGLMALSGSSTYTGTTTISAGTLAIRA